mmetsp:Transcript_26415/g.57491  ORF Transcript_26415/g.57491 Transcript_26415/m.57491 type:complete len:113 (-) Transcript_26415:76-414(-)
MGREQSLDSSLHPSSLSNLFDTLNQKAIIKYYKSLPLTREAILKRYRYKRTRRRYNRKLYSNKARVTYTKECFNEGQEITQMSNKQLCPLEMKMLQDMLTVEPGNTTMFAAQ